MKVAGGSGSLPEGNTPLEESEVDGLIPDHLTTRDQLNAWEQANISRAMDWLQRRREKQTVLDIKFLMDLHRHMFGDTWRWAGTWRSTERNLGHSPHLIAEGLHNLLADTKFWIEHATYPGDEIAARFHHRLVSIHPFPNGNGRHARLLTDLLLKSLGRERFSWGAGELVAIGVVRSHYLRALREADRGGIEALVAFCRS